MFRNCRTGLLFVIAVFVIGVGRASGTVISASGGSGPSEATVHDMDTSNGWTIGTGTNPNGVILDPTAGPWRKTLLGPNGAGFSADDTGQTAPASFQLVENIVIVGNLPWTDWHEKIVTPGWTFGPVLLSVNGGPPPAGSNVLYTPQSWPTVGGQAEWTFPAQQPGTLLTFTKTLNWVGDPLLIGNLFFGPVVIEEYPTPEPGMLGFWVSGSLLLARRRR